MSTGRSYEEARERARVLAARLGQLTGFRVSITWTEQASLSVSVRVRPDQAGHPVESLTLLDLMQSGDRCGTHERGATGPEGYTTTRLTVWMEIDYVTPEEPKSKEGEQS